MVLSQLVMQYSMIQGVNVRETKVDTRDLFDAGTGDSG